MLQALSVFPTPDREDPVVSVRSWLTSAAVAAGLVLGLMPPPAGAADPKADYTFGSLKATPPDVVVDPAAYFFHRAVAEHALMRKDDAMRSIVRLLDDVADAPDRYAMLGRILFVEMATWTRDEKDLANIRRLMDNSERRLGHA